MDFAGIRIDTDQAHSRGFGTFSLLSLPFRLCFADTGKNQECPTPGLS